jgi:hypothetical protein
MPFGKWSILRRFQLAILRAFFLSPDLRIPITTHFQIPFCIFYILILERFNNRRDYNPESE